MMTPPTIRVGPFRWQCSAPGSSGAVSRSGPCRRISLASRLPSPPSALSVLSLFGSFVGTMHLLDSLPPCMKGSPDLVRVVRWYYASARLPTTVHEGLALASSPSGPLPCGARAVAGSLGSRAPRGHPVSLHAWGLRLRRIGRALAFFVHCRVAF